MKQAEILSVQTNTPENNQRDTIVVREQYKDSPLTIIGLDGETKWFAALANKRLTEYYNTKEEVEQILENKPWELIIAMVVAVAEDTVNYIQRELTEN